MFDPDEERQRKLWLELMRNRSGASKTFYDRIPQEIASTAPQKAPAAPSAKTINLSSQDVKDLARIAQAEGAILLGQEGVGPKEAYGSVADVILNRMASGKYPTTVRGVIEQPRQFEPVDRYGGFEKLPDPRPETVGALKEYLGNRMGGGSAVVGKADHFLNPAFSDPKALNTWAKDWQNWQSIGQGSVQHRFAQLNDVPDYQIQMEHGPFTRGDPVGAPIPKSMNQEQVQKFVAQASEPPVQQAKAPPPPPPPTSLADKAKAPTTSTSSPFGQFGDFIQARFSQSPMGQMISPQSPPTPAAAANTGMSAVGGAAAPAAPGMGMMAGLMGALGGLAGDAQAQQQIVQQHQQQAAEEQRKRMAYAMSNWGFLS